MNNPLNKLETSKHKSYYFTERQNNTFTTSELESNHEAILRLCDNILFMSEDSNILDKIVLTHDYKD